MSTSFENLAPDLWLLTYPLKTLGVDLRRVVTVIRLSSGKLIIHSTAPFTPDDIAGIRALGETTWLVDALLRHDTFATEGRAAFPSATYLAPAGFAPGIATRPILPPPREWSEEIAVLAVAGAPSFGEIVMLHRPSRTLIVADLVIHFPGSQGAWANLLLKVATAGPTHDPGVTRPFKMAVKDRASYEASIGEILAWDFDRVVVGHGVVIETGGKEKLRTALESAGMIS